MSQSRQEFQHIIRIAGTDVDGTMKVIHAISKIKGVGMPLANAIARKAEINPDTRVGYLTEQDKTKIEDIIANPGKHGITPWMLNRQKDQETGQNQHLIGADLALQIKTDIEGMKNVKSWRGFRHAYGLRVRGQHTRTTGRKGKAVGVKKKELIAKTRKEPAA